VNSFIDDIQRKVREDAAGADGGSPTGASGTHQSDIQYLPGGMGTVKPALAALRSRKKTWKMRRRKTAEGVELDFEGKLVVRVGSGQLQEFADSILDIDQSDIQSVTLVQISERVGGPLNEASGDSPVDLEDRLLQFERAIRRVMNTEPVRPAVKVVQEFRRQFPEYTPSEMPRVMVRLFDDSTISRDIQQIKDVLKREYTGDRGGIEMILEALRTRQPINAFAGISAYDEMLAFSASAPFAGGTIRLMCSVDFLYQPQMSFVISDKTALGTVARRSDVIVAGNKVYPTGNVFSTDMVRDIKQADDAVSRGDEGSNRG